MTLLELKILGGVALLCAVLFGLHWYDDRQQAIGAQACEISAQKSYSAGVAAQAASTAAETARNTDLAKQLEDLRAKRSTQHAAITSNVDTLSRRPVYATVCVDDDGLRNINAALLGTPAPAAGGDLAGSAAALPEAQAASR